MTLWNQRARRSFLIHESTRKSIKKIIKKCFFPVPKRRFRTTLTICVLFIAEHGNGFAQKTATFHSKSTEKCARLVEKRTKTANDFTARWVTGPEGKQRDLLW